MKRGSQNSLNFKTVNIKIKTIFILRHPLSHFKNLFSQETSLIYHPIIFHRSQTYHNKKTIYGE